MLLLLLYGRASFHFVVRDWLALLLLLLPLLAQIEPRKPLFMAFIFLFLSFFFFFLSFLFRMDIARYE